MFLLFQRMVTTVLNLNLSCALCLLQRGGGDLADSGAGCSADHGHSGTLSGAAAEVTALRRDD